MDCRNAQPLLSEYLDNALSARQTWELDKHLAECHECTRALNETRRLVQTLADAPRFEVSTDFMDKLQSRITAIEPAPQPRAWFTSLSELFRPRLSPLLGAAGACCALAALVVTLYHPSAPETSIKALEPVAVQTAKSQNVALAASNPLEDLSAANLAAHANADSGTEGESVE